MQDSSASSGKIDTNLRVEDDCLRAELRDSYLTAIQWRVFDEQHYSRSSESRARGVHPFQDYIETGEALAIAPSRLFDPAFYLRENRDVGAANISPLLHFIAWGKSEGRLPYAGAADESGVQYEEWIRQFDNWTPERLSGLRDRLGSFGQMPKISIIVPTYNSDERYLTLCLQSVLDQVYPNWELCIADDASTCPHVREVIAAFAARDPRVKSVFREENGHISACSNSALSLATGDFIALLDHDDVLPAHALYFVAKAVNDKPSAQLIYSDEDKVDDGERRFDPHFKTEWNLDLLYSQNYICHLLVIRRDVIDLIGGFRTGVEGAQDYDLILRSLAFLHVDNIVHIPRILYHWRAIPGSTAVSADEKNYAVAAGIKSLRDHFQSKGEDVDVSGTHIATMYRVTRKLPEDVPHVSILIPTRDHKTILELCISSILEMTTYPNYSISILNNRSAKPETLDYFKDICALDSRVSVIDCDMDFNYSAINNLGAGSVDGTVLALLNNDIEVISPEWLTEMTGQALRKDVGCVGAKLYYSNDTIQHAGIIVGIGGVAGHSHKKQRRNDPGYFGRLFTIHEVSAVTAACLVIRKDIFEEVGGLDETDLRVAFNDVDFCLKVRAAGYRNIWTPYAELYHHESLSRGYEDTPEKIERFSQEVKFLKAKWGDVLKADPFFNPNLSYSAEKFGLAWPPVVESYS